jgi:Spy/CpxP family protein refolding chaperone
MKVKFNLKVGALCAILVAMLVTPGLGQVKPDEKMERFKQRRIQIIKQLKLAPDKEKAVLGVEDKYSSQRQEIVTGMKKNQEELTAALAVPQPDEAKVKGLVSAVTGGMDSLFNSFKSQREEEMALMTPIEQGKYLLEMGKWREEMFKGPKPGPEKKK